MDKLCSEEIRIALDMFLCKEVTDDRKIYLFGHCNATEIVIDELLQEGHEISAILDNSIEKQGREFRGIKIQSPMVIQAEKANEAIVLIASRFYEEMKAQLRMLGFQGKVVKLLEYNTYAEYSLTEDVISRKAARVENGVKIISGIEHKHPGCFRIFCPLAALGDVYFCMSYLPLFMEKRGIKKCVICVASQACAKVVSLFGQEHIEILPQYDLDAAIQASLYTRDPNAFIAHQDRPYVVNLHKALYVKMIPLEQIYLYGVFGLPSESKPCVPKCWLPYENLVEIVPGKTVILSPYAKSVIPLPDKVWKDIVEDYTNQGYDVYTNTVGDEKPLEGTKKISPDITQMKSLVEHAGTFIGIRSGLCDVLKTAKCKKIALYPDYNYSDTKWKAIDMYRIEGFDNIEVKEGFEWKKR